MQICALVIIGLYHTVSDSNEEDGEIVSILYSYRERKKEDKYKEELRKIVFIFLGKGFFFFFWWLNWRKEY